MIGYVGRVTSLMLLAAIAGSGQQGSGVLKGKVEDEKGKPIAKAEIRVMNSQTRAISETETDQAGRYRLELEPGDYTVSLDAEGFKGGTLVNMQQVEAGKESEVKTVRLEKGKRTSLVRGVVFNTQGFGVRGAKVKLQRVPTEDEEKEGKRVESLNRDYVTNSRGEFAFRLPPIRARYRVSAILDGYKPDTKVIDVTESEAVPVALTLEAIKRN